MDRVRILAATAIAVVAAFTLVSAVNGQEKQARSVTVKLDTAGGKGAGTVKLTQDGKMIDVVVKARGLSRGFHGFHIHETGECVAPSKDDEGKTGAFLSAGGHVAHGDQTHGEHAGDMPSLIAGKNGRASASFALPGSLASLLKGDGSAVMIHAGPDNFANIPDRYKPAADEETLSTGDSGDRFACGVLES